MIPDANASLNALIKSAVGAGASVSFAPPRPHESKGQTPHPTVGAFLFDICRSDDGFSTQAQDVRDTAGAVIARRTPVRRYRLRYLLWASVPQDSGVEHRVLGTVISALSGLDAIPTTCLQGSMAAGGGPVQLALAPADSPVRPYEVWDRLGCPPRASVELVLTAGAVPDDAPHIASLPRRFHLELTQPGA
ncbi:Pvc16 family protein [Streptomyces sp. TRM72054]|uniref:Pvc16 family protein n=1 Tax=Streptomyces sp. TRM72054 TaxID=2870562 RepID=UPI001C8BD596|nr:Pvc16 family protein [Streptomyces sp. TRM72054]MBX9394354.1 Pvc16 family protein [Streptomyces sp. TRM72054]